MLALLGFLVVLVASTSDDEPASVGSDAQTRAQDRAAQSSLRNALTAAKTIYTDNEDYRDAGADQLAEAEPSLTFVNAPRESADPRQVSVASDDREGVGRHHRFGAAVLSESGTCFYIRDDTEGYGTEFGFGEGGDECDGATALLTATEVEWPQAAGR